MEKQTRIRLLRLATIALPVVALDQATKFIVARYMTLHSSIPVIPGFFNITYLYNTGGAFGLFAESAPWVRMALFLGLSLAAAGLVVYLYFQTPPEERLFSAALCLILGGAVGNLIDRFRTGMVLDFLDLYASGRHWPAFNVADMAVSGGVAILAVLFVLKKDPF
ncbi:MAG: signal peptidase II [Deltaproteobacteria bacterium]|nr:signal peptidase II [Deltaproteobacteria bacterium]